LNSTHQTVRRPSVAKQVKILLQQSMNCCAFPNCKAMLTAPKSGDDDTAVLSMIAHIVGISKNGPRFDPGFSITQLNSEENMILLCPLHHSQVDAQTSTYSVEQLKKMKKDHELWANKIWRDNILTVNNTELEIVTRYLMSSPKIVPFERKLTPPKDKLKKNGLSKRTEDLMVWSLAKSEEVGKFIAHMEQITPDFSEKLKSSFVERYEQCKQEGLEGDEIFSELLEMATGPKPDFQRQAAGLAVLTHLFELCEVFEK